jgi:hypothetical protein
MNIFSIFECLPRLLNGILGITVYAFHGIGLGVSENYTRTSEGAELLAVIPIIVIITIGAWIMNTSI